MSSTAANRAGVAPGVTPLSVYAGRQIQPRQVRFTVASQRPEPFMATPPAWMTGDLPCIGGTRWDDDLRDAPNQDEIASAMCAGCPVLEKCLESALAEEGTTSARNRYMIRGGKSPAGRAELAAERRVCSKGHEGAWSARGQRCLKCKVEMRKAS